MQSIQSSPVLNSFTSIGTKYLEIGNSLQDPKIFPRFKIARKHMKKNYIRIYSSYNCCVSTKIYSVIFYKKS